MGLIRWILSLAILTMWCALIGTGLYVAMYEPADETPSAQAIVVLGGNPATDGVLRGESEQRLERAVALYEQGAAPLLVLTGGGDEPVAPVMAEAARAAGVPEEAIRIEAASRSTLQNALFTSDFADLDKAEPIIIVTQRYHLPRAWASFRWAGFQVVHRSAADPAGEFTINRQLLAETVKWPLNILRAAAASVAMVADTPRENYLKYLE
jgi:uncharacterized SAM-binding protein YcdF (DUF218 family)